MAEPARKAFSFTLPEDEANTLDAALAYVQWAYPDMTTEDCLTAIVRIGQAEMVSRLNRAELHRTARENRNG